MRNKILKSKKILLDKKSKYLRNLIIDCLSNEGRGHVGPSFSIVEIIRVIYENFLIKNNDKFILSKGHGCLALYVILFTKGYLTRKQLLDVGKFNAIIAGHPEHITPGVELSTGSLGHGFSVGSGMALASRLKKKKSYIYVLMGDGELNEGSVWEAAMSVSKNNLSNLISFIDYNKYQAYGSVKTVSKIDNLNAKWKSFGFNVLECNGHDIIEIKKNILKAKKNKKKPTVIICHTIKGKGVAFIENKVDWHHKNNISKDDIKKLREKLR